MYGKTIILPSKMRIRAYCLGDGMVLLFAVGDSVDWYKTRYRLTIKQDVYEKNMSGTTV